MGEKNTKNQRMPVCQSQISKGKTLWVTAFSMKYSQRTLVKISPVCWFIWLVAVWGSLPYNLLRACRASWEMCYTFQIIVKQKFCMKDSYLQDTLMFYLSDIVRNYVQYVVKIP